MGKIIYSQTLDNFIKKTVNFGDLTMKDWHHRLTIVRGGVQ